MTRDATMKLSTVRERMSAIGLWDEGRSRPVFGWAPVLFGWMIQCDAGGQNVFINGVSWDASIKIPFSGYSAYAENAGKFAALAG